MGIEMLKKPRELKIPDLGSTIHSHEVIFLQHIEKQGQGNQCQTL